MYERDYIMRLIKEMVRAVLKLIFHIDTESPAEEQLEDSEEKAVLKTLLDLADEGKINEAENAVFEITENRDYKDLEAALLFYSYLNDKSDEFLETNDFSRDEIKDGLRELASRYGISSIADIFLK